MAILLTGGLGYIGSHICTALLPRGEELIVVDNLSNASADVLPRLRQARTPQCPQALPPWAPTPRVWRSDGR